MKKTKLLILLALLIMALSVIGGTAMAGSPDTSSNATWTAQYYNNRYLEGTPALTREESSINNDWGYNAPAPGISQTNFSVRWTTVTKFDGGTYNFTATVDDGVRVWVDGELLIDAWYEQAPATHTGQKYLSAGDHRVQMAYFQATGGATAKLSWDKTSGGVYPTPPPAGESKADWRAEYFNNPNLQGSPSLVQQEKRINYDWGYNPPAPGISQTNFSIRWTADIEFTPGTYTFSSTTDDGVRVWVDGELIIDQWKEQPVTTYTGTKYLTAGSHRVQMAHFQATGAAVAKFWWRLDQPTPGVTPTPPCPCPPTAEKLFIDNHDENFIWGGPSQNRNTAPGGIGGSYFWTKNTVTYPENYGKWTPIFSRSGRYEVLVHIPGDYATTTNLRYRIMHNGQRHDAIVNQSWYNNQWVSLGTYTFSGDNTGREFIVAYDNTREYYTSTCIAFDAVKLVPR